MKAAIVRVSDSAVIASWDDPAVVDLADVPFAPDGCSYIAVSDELYNALNEIINAEGRLAWKYDSVSNTIAPNPRPSQRPFMVICDTATRGILALDRAIPEFLNPGQDIVEVSLSDFMTVQASLSHEPTAIVPAWNCALDGTVTPRSDTRFELRVTVNGTVTAGIPANIDFELFDSNGNSAPVNGSRNIVITHNGQVEIKELTLVSGSKIATPTLSVGKYYISSAEPMLYRVSGDLVIEAVDSW